MQSQIPVPGSIVWIRQARWRVDASRRERAVVRLDVSERGGLGRRRTFLAPFDRVESADEGTLARRVRPQQARARLADLIRRAGDSRRLPTAVDAGVDVLPHQLEPALAVLNGVRRVLIADDVGLGKTIQAAFVLAELRRRRPTLRALIIVPSSLQAQWDDELRVRFHIRSMSASAAEFQQLAQSGQRGENPWHKSGVWLTSADYLKQPHVFDALPPRAWDLVIIDEAHGVCGDSGRHAVAAEIARRARCLLLLTATPHSGDEIKCDRLMSLGALPCSADELLTFRRTRRDISRPGVRRVRWQMIAPSAEETRLLDVLLNYEAAVLRAAGAARKPAALLLLSVFRKRALSTSGALRSSLDRRLAWLQRSDSLSDSTWLQPRLRWDEETAETGEDEDSALCAEIGMGTGTERAWLSRLRILAMTAARNESKLKHLAALVTRAREPVVLFTEFRDSLTLLAGRLASSHHVSVLHGGLDAAEQQREIRQFLDGRTAVLIATDVASQGLNLQSRARWVVNLELPWNPARLEQRAGRVDRIGQVRAVHITMLVTRHHAESGLLTALARKTLSAQRAFGADTLQSLAPDRRQLQACLLEGQPFNAAAMPARAVRFSRSWIRPARRLAGSLERDRRLAQHWRGPAAAGGVAFVASARRVLRQIGGSNDRLAVFSVPIVDRSGTLIERHLAAIAISDGSAIAAAAGEAVRVAAARARRLERLRQSQRPIHVAREHAIAAALQTASGLDLFQPGLFEQRALRASAATTRNASQIGDALDRSVRAIEDAACITAGAPALVLFLV